MSKKLPKPKTLLVDADYLVYAAGFAAQHTEYVVYRPNGANKVGRYDSMENLRKDWPDYPKEELFKRTAVEPVENALRSCKVMLESAVDQANEKYQADLDVLVFLTGSGNYREKIATIRPYKGNRVNAERPVYFPDIRNYLMTTHGGIIVDGMEADDEVAIRQTEAEYWRSCIMGIDKDLLQVPGHHFNPNKGFAKISPIHGLRLFYRQILSGDAADNIAGCYKIGEAGAKKLLKPGMSEEDMYRTCIDQYAYSLDRYGDKTGYDYLPPEEAVEENAHLLWLLRARDREAGGWIAPV